MLARRLGCGLRSAGEAIRARSLELNVDPVALPLVEHRSIDEGTLELARSSKDCLVIEGTFLDVLLSDLENVLKIELICEEAERRQRFKTRSGKDSLKQRDHADRHLRELLHGCREGTRDITIDTTSKTPEEITEEIIEWAQGTSSHKPPD